MQLHHRAQADSRQRELLLGEAEVRELLINETVLHWSRLPCPGCAFLHAERGERPS
jgi:hypothetical protein